MAQAYVGTSGWSYPHWRKPFYEGRPAKEWLPSYAGRFGTVEVGKTFHHMPDPRRLEDWAASVPNDFRFALRLWRGITHVGRLQDTRRLLDEFMGAASRLPVPNRGPILVQLPPGMQADAARLERFLAEFRRARRQARWRVAVEFRNASWLSPEVEQVLDEHHAALCLHDMPRHAPVAEPNAAPFVYVRRHGPRGTYRGSYGDARIAADAARVKAWLAEGRDVYVYYNNDRGGQAPRDAARLADAIGAPRASTARRARVLTA